MAASRRADAKSALLAAAGIVENHYTYHGTYDGATLSGAKAISRHGHYVLSITIQGANGYSLLATRSGAQAGDKCGDYTYNQDGQIDVVSAANDKTKCL
jgi:type IV pilus assembly protein PilE